jgi:hypothetical protein
MLIILAVVLAVALLLASQLMKSAGQASGNVENRSEAIFNKTTVGGAGDYCTDDAGCAAPLKCVSNKCASA